MSGRRSPWPFILSLVAVALILGAAFLLFDKVSTNDREMDQNHYYNLTGDDQVALVVNDTLLEQKGIRIGEEVYLDYPTVWRTLNSGFYWEPGSGKMLLTLPEGNLSWEAEEGGALILRDNIPYLSASCVQEHSDIEMTILTDPNRIVARTNWENVTAERILKDTEIRNRADRKGEVLTRVKKGDLVVLLENTPVWCKVATADGYSGYIQKSEFEPAPEGSMTHETDERFRFPHIFLEEKVCLGWQYMQSTEDKQLQGLIARAKGLNVISPTWFQFSDLSGKLQSYATKEYVDQAHAKGIQVWGCLQDLYGSEFNAGKVLNSFENREYVIRQLLDVAEKTGMDGINIDIETIERESSAQYLQFLRELSVAAHAEGLIVSSDTYVPLYTPYYNRAEQAKVVDYVILMSYDEHTVGSGEAGSVASLPFVEQGIKDALEEVPSEQLINGIPFFTRGWTTVFGETRPQSQAFGMNEADSWADAHRISLYWDSEVGQNMGSAEEEDARYSIWMEDEKSIEEKMKLIPRYDLAGVACWRLGLERNAIWEIIDKYLAE